MKPIIEPISTATVVALSRLFIVIAMDVLGIVFIFGIGSFGQLQIFALMTVMCFLAILFIVGVVVKGMGPTIDRLRLKRLTASTKEFSVEGTIVSKEDNYIGLDKSQNVFGSNSERWQSVIKILLKDGDTIVVNCTGDAAVNSGLDALCGQQVTVNVREWYNSRGEVIKRIFAKSPSLA